MMNKGPVSVRIRIWVFIMYLIMNDIFVRLNHQGEARFDHQGRQLKTEALPRPRGHLQDKILAMQGRQARRPL